MRRHDVALELLQREEQQRDPDRGQRVLHERDEDRRQRAEHRPDVRHELHERRRTAPKARAYVRPSGKIPSDPEDPQRDAGARPHDQAEQQLAADVADTARCTRVG